MERDDPIALIDSLELAEAVCRFKASPAFERLQQELGSRIKAWAAEEGLPGETREQTVDEPPEPLVK